MGLKQTPALVRGVLACLAAIAAGLVFPAAADPPLPAAEPGAVAGTEPPARPASFREFVEARTRQPQITLSADGRTLYIVGSFDEGSYLRAGKVIRAAPDLQTVYLASYGGLTTEGRLLALLIRQRRLDTYVEHVCASACTMAFVAGAKRTLGASAKLGFHQSYVVGSLGTTDFDDKIDAPYAAQRGFPPVVGISGTHVMRRTFEDAGLNPVFIARALATPSWSMWYPDTNTLRTGFVFTRTATADELPPPPGTGRTRAEVDADLAAFPLWRAFKAFSPANYEEVASEVWRDANTGSTAAIARWRGRELLLGHVEEELKTAPDALLEELVAIRGEQARWERQHGYAQCQVDTDFEPRAPGHDELAFAAREDAVILRLLGSKARVAGVPEDKAEEAFSKFAGQIAANGSFDLWTRAGGDYGCRSGYQLIEAIAGLAPKQRPKAYRALLSIPVRQPWMVAETRRDKRPVNANERPARNQPETATRTGD